MRKHFLFLVCIFMALLPQTTLCQNSDLQSFLSGQKEKYFTKGHPKAKGINISIEYPAHWQRSEGERPHIVQNFSGDASDGITKMCVITVEDLPELLKPFLSEDLSDEIFSPETLKEMLPSGARLLRGDKTMYDGEPGSWMIYVMPGERSGFKFKVYALTHVFLSSGKLVMLQCSVIGLASDGETIEQIFSEYLPLFYQMGNSIIIYDKWEKKTTDYKSDASSPSNNDMVHHRDEANGFAIWYPKTWAKVPTTYGATKLKVVSKSGAGGDDFNVVVISDPAFQKITGERMVEMWLEQPEAGLAQFRKAYPDAKLIKSGKTYLDNKPAYYVIFDGTYRSFDFEFPMRILQVSAVYNGRAYYLTSRTGPDEFDDMKPIFTLIMGGFKFLHMEATDYKSDTSSVVSKGWLGPTEIFLIFILLVILIGVPIIIIIRIRKKNNMMESNYTQIETKYKGVRGWLLLFCLGLTVFGPLIGIGNLAISYEELNPYFDLFPGLLNLWIIDSILSICLIIFAIYTGFILFSIRPGAVKTAKIYLFVALGYSTIASLLLPFIAGLPSEVTQNILQEGIGKFIGACITFAIWYSYLLKSKRVKATYGTLENKSTVGL